jgi:hypothetical protein
VACRASLISAMQSTRHPETHHTAVSATALRIGCCMAAFAWCSTMCNPLAGAKRLPLFFSGKVSDLPASGLISTQNNAKPATGPGEDRPPVSPAMLLPLVVENGGQL